MKTIIIPIQGHSAFIHLFKLACNLFPGQQINCRFLQIRPIPDDYNDLLTLGRNCTACTPFNSYFIRATAEMAAEYGDRIQVEADHIYGDSPVVFRNYAEHNTADLVIYDQQEWQHSDQQCSLNIFRMVSRSKCELMYVAIGSKLLQHEPGRQIKKDSKQAVPSSIQYQYNITADKLSIAQANVYGNEVVAKKISNLSRYFLSENSLRKMLPQQSSGLLWITK